MQRRQFLGQVARGLLGASALGACSDLPGGSRIAPPGRLGGRLSTSATARWGLPGDGQAEGLLPQAYRPEGMLELYMVGGMTPWETFYTVPEHGQPDKGGPFAGQQWWSFQERGRPTLPEFYRERCQHYDGNAYQPFGLDAAGMTVNLGPFVKPLRDRPDLLARMRIWVMHHELQPHEAAIPYAITGNRIGVPRLCALGTHIQRFSQDGGPADRTAPWSYAVLHSSLKADRGDPVGATGLHRASTRPLVIRLGPYSRLAERLGRTNVAGHRDKLDKLVAHYTQAYRRHLDTSRDGAPLTLRSAGLDDFDFARYVLSHADDLSTLLTADKLRPEQGSICGREPALDETTTGLKLAAHLLTAPTNRARYVQMMDGGLYPDPAGMGYDSHPEHVMSQGGNIMHSLTGLAGVINRPGENDPSKLDLDRHFVLINTEFGRTPYPEYTKTNPDGNGTNHWPWGYCIVGFGSFINEDRAGIIGSIGEDGRAVSGFSPAEHRAAMLLALGIWPFNEEGFAVGDVGGGVKTELDAAMRLREEVLGYPA